MVIGFSKESIKRNGEPNTHTFMRICDKRKKERQQKHTKNGLKHTNHIKDNKEK